MYHENVNANVTVEYVIQIKIGITINAGRGCKNLKNHVCKKCILLQVLVKMLTIDIRKYY